MSRRKRRDTVPAEWTETEVRAFHADKAFAAAINAEQSYPPGEYLESCRGSSCGTTPANRRRKRCADVRANGEDSMPTDCKHEWIWQHDYQECRLCGRDRPQGETIVRLRDGLEGCRFKVGRELDEHIDGVLAG